MVSLTALWVPIVLSAVVVFIVSSILHMALPYHRSDYGKLPNEDEVLEAMRSAGVARGSYMFPHCPSPKDASTPEMQEKFNHGPVGIMMVLPPGQPAMGKYLGMWFVFCLLVSFFVAYLTGRTLDAGVDYLLVFRVAGTAAFLAYGLGQLMDSIWKAQPWIVTVKHVFDGLVYALFTAGVYGWLWPR